MDIYVLFRQTMGGGTPIYVKSFTHLETMREYLREKVRVTFSTEVKNIHRPELSLPYSYFYIKDEVVEYVPLSKRKDFVPDSLMLVVPSSTNPPEAPDGAYPEDAYTYYGVYMEKDTLNIYRSLGCTCPDFQHRKVTEYSCKHMRGAEATVAMNRCDLRVQDGILAREI